MKRLALIALSWLAIVQVALAATRTSSQSGNWSSTSTWGGAAAPGDGDIAIIATGHTVTVTADVTVGSNSSNVGDAVEIQATNSGTYGKLIVNDGVTLTLKGNDATNNTAMEIDRYAVFEPQPGAIIQVDATANYETVIANAGIINAIGTLAKPITFRATAASTTWNNSVASESKTGSGYTYDKQAKVASRLFTNPWISNAAGTGIGSLGDSSVSITAQSPSSICQTQVATREDVTSAGKFFIDYDGGRILFYHDYADGNPGFTLAYKYLTFNGWGIQSIQDTTYNEAKFDYCVFQYMGGTSSRQYGIENRYKYSATNTANRLFQLKNSTVSYCRQFCQLRQSAGTSGDPLLISGNTFNECANVGFGAALAFAEAPIVSYVNITGNVLNGRKFFTISPPATSIIQHVGINISNNTGTCASILDGGFFSELYDGVIEGNNIDCLPGSDARLFQDIKGSTSHPLIVQDNIFRRGNRFCSGALGDVTIRRNVVDSFDHHSITGPTADDVYAPNVLAENNLFFSREDPGGSGAFETGYNHRHHLHNWRFINNTVGRGLTAMLSLGDTQDDGAQVLATGLIVANNVCYQPTYGIARNANDDNEMTRLHIPFLDYNLIYNPSSGQVSGYNKQATFIKGSTAYNLDGTRSVLGVALFDPLYTLPESTNRSLVFTYTSATNKTLAWGGGTAVQLVFDSGTCTSASTSTEGRYTTLTDSGKSWSTTLNSGSVVRSKWVKITGGTGAGQIGAITFNTATTLRIVPAFSVALATDSTYAIIEPEVQLFDSGATNYVRAGVYLPELPTSSQTDSNITITAANLTTDPLLTNTSGNTAADYKVSGSSPGIGAAYATYAPSLDYFGTTRTTPDMGFYEYVADSAARPQMIISQLAPQRAWQRFISLTPMALVQ